MIKQYDTCNLLLHDRYSCNEENLCFYGCHEGYCWSQCNAVAKFTWDGPPGTCSTTYVTFSLIGYYILRTYLESEL